MARAPIDAFIGRSVRLQSPLGPLDLGVVDADHPGVAEGISLLLMRSIQDAREESGGHLPSWLVDDIERNYISPNKVRTLWAKNGHRFVVVLDSEIVATVHVASRHSVILTVDRHRNNVEASEHPGFKPAGFHHVVNISVKHELRRAGLATRMIDGILEHFRELFDGHGLWVRADPPWHAGLAGLGFEHDPSMDVFLPEDAVRTAGLAHADFNRLHACSCTPSAAARPDVLTARPLAMLRKKLQYVSFTRAFDSKVAGEARRRAVFSIRPSWDTRVDALEAHAVDWGGSFRVLPTAVARPETVDDLCAVMADATSRGRGVTIRGRGQSMAGQSLGDGLIVSTEQLARIIDIGPDRITVEGGASLLSLVEALRERQLYPPVLTSWLSASVGGVLASGGFGRGSPRSGLLIDHVLSLVVVTGDGRRIACSRTQAGWLFDAVLGGYGQFGIIAEATLRLERRRPFIRIETSAVGDDVRMLGALLADGDAYHVSASVGPGGWTVVRAYEQDEPTEHRFDAWISSRGRAPTGPSTIVQLVTPPSSLSAVLTLVEARARLEAGDVVRIHPVRQLRSYRGASLVPIAPGVADGGTVHVVSLVRELRGRSLAPIEAEGQELGLEAASIGAAITLQGALPRDGSAWQRRLGERHAEAMRAKALADPVGVLGPARPRDAARPGS